MKTIEGLLGLAALGVFFTGTYKAVMGEAVWGASEYILVGMTLAVLVGVINKAIENGKGS